MSSAIPFLQAKHFSPCSYRKIDLVVLHAMEAPDKPGTATAVANWFAGPDAPKASAHFCIDPTMTIQCVNEMDIAWAAPGTNHDGIHLEHAGYSKYTGVQWGDAAGKLMLARSAELTAELCLQYGLPVEYVDAEGLLIGRCGITTHFDVTVACQLAKSRKLTASAFFGAHTDHTDPGPGFPIQSFIDAVKAQVEA